jgi:hypothetical protein
MSVGNLMSNVRNIQCLGSRKVQGKAQSRDESDSSFVNVQSPFFWCRARSYHHMQRSSEFSQSRLNPRRQGAEQRELRTETGYGEQDAANFVSNV